MTTKDWQEITLKFNQEKARLNKIAVTIEASNQMIAKVKEMTGETVSINDAIAHLAKAAIFSK